ncbi:MULTISPECIES: hypothetical protein [Streptacidiphilus]|uniref:DUF3311 domain-containing protein n=2 Tax=Streptacidiphilus TaxID=228398 RepID=A0ABV6V0R2_9ACTN|nr:hypothetical protein [Streptacidiphilus jeojiense]
MMRTPHALWAAVPVLALLGTPFLPFVNGPHLWLGIPSVMFWCLLWTAGTTVSLLLVDRRFRGGDDESDEYDDTQEAAA